MTAATCVIASGEHQPWTAWAACSAGIAAERRSGYLAIAVSISRRRSSGTGVVAGSGITAGALVRSTASSQPGTREPWPKRGTRPASDPTGSRCSPWRSLSSSLMSGARR